MSLLLPKHAARRNLGGPVMFGVQGAREVIVLEDALVMKFDFGESGSPIQSGFTEVLSTTAYSVELGYGWTVSVTDVDRGTLSGTEFSALLQDIHGNASTRTFRADVAEGTYAVTVFFGDTSARNSRVWANGGGDDVVVEVSTAADEYKHETFTVEVDANGQLDLTFSRVSGGFWTSNGVVIRSIGGVGSLGITLSDTTGDIHTFGVSGGTANAYYTVTTTAGTITTADADDCFAGVQVKASASGSFDFTLDYAVAGGSITITVEEVTGAEKGTKTFFE